MITVVVFIAVHPSYISYLITRIQRIITNLLIGFVTHYVLIIYINMRLLCCTIKYITSNVISCNL